MLPEGRDPWIKGMMVGGRSSSIDILDEDRGFRSISRDAIVEVRLVTHLRKSYIEDEELLKFEKEDMKRRSEVHEMAELHLYREHTPYLINYPKNSPPRQIVSVPLTGFLRHLVNLGPSLHVFLLEL